MNGVQMIYCHLSNSLLTLNSHSVFPSSLHLSKCIDLQLILLLLLQPFNDLFSRTTWVSQHQIGKPFWILLEQEMMGWR